MTLWVLKIYHIVSIKLKWQLYLCQQILSKFLWDSNKLVTSKISFYTTESRLKLSTNSTKWVWELLISKLWSKKEKNSHKLTFLTLKWVPVIFTLFPLQVGQLDHQRVLWSAILISFLFCHQLGKLVLGIQKMMFTYLSFLYPIYSKG